MNNLVPSLQAGSKEAGWSPGHTFDNWTPIVESDFITIANFSAPKTG
jgi:hypothetical protein